MAHGIIRVRNVSSKEMGATEIHNERKYEENGIKNPKNINIQDSEKNISWVRGGGFSSDPERKEVSYKEAIEARFKEAGVEPRKNSVNAIEFMVSASKDLFQNWTDPKTGKYYPSYDEKAYLENTIAWLEKRYGKENVVAFSIHLDEPGATAHAHVIVTPIVEKEIKWKNRNGEGTKTENRLVAREITGGPEKLRQLQDDFFGHVSTRYPNHAEWYRGTLVEHQMKIYTKETNHEIGLMRKELEGIKDEAERKVFTEKIEQKTQEFENKINQFQEKIEIRKDRNKYGGWKKGQEFAHDEPLVDKKEPLTEKPERLSVKPERLSEKSEPLVVKKEPLFKPTPKKDMGMGM